MQDIVLITVKYHIAVSVYYNSEHITSFLLVKSEQNRENL